MPQKYEKRPAGPNNVEVQYTDQNGKVTTVTVPSHLSDDIMKRTVFVQSLRGAQGLDEIPKKPTTGPIGALRRVFGDMAEGIEQTVRDPVGTASGMAQQAISGVQNIQQGRAGIENIPVFGPMLDSIAKTAESGDVSGAVTEGLLQSIPAFQGGFKRVSPTVPGIVTGIPKTYPQRTGRLQWLQAILEGVPGGAAVFRRMRDTQEKAAVTISNEIIDSIRSGKRPLDAVDVGELFLNALDEGEVRLNAPAREIYGRIDAELGTTTELITKRGFDPDVAYPRIVETKVPRRVSPVMPETASLKELAKPILERLKDESLLINPADFASIRGTLDRIVNAPDRLPFQAFQDARSDLLRAARALDDPLPGKKAGIVNQLAPATDAAMSEALIQSGRADLLTELRQANAIWRETAGMLGERTIKQLLNSSPEAVTGILSRSPTQTIRALKKLVPRDILDDAAAAMVRRDIIDKSTGGQLTETTLKRAGVSDDLQIAQQRLSAQQMKRNVERMEGRLAELVGEGPAKRIVQLTADLFDIQPQSTPGQMVVRLVASGAIIGSAALVLQGIIEAAALMRTGTMVLAANLTSRLLVRHPGSRTVFRNLITALNKGNVPQATFWAQRINEFERSRQEQAPSPELASRPWQTTPIQAVPQ